jgi:GT2 family glycosyltransferase
MTSSDLPAKFSVAVVLVNWNGWRDTVECIDTILAQNHENLHIFVVDNDSRDNSVEHICAWCAEPKAEAGWVKHDAVHRWSDRASPPSISHQVVDRPHAVLECIAGNCRVTVIRSGANLGFAGGCNTAVRAAGLANYDFYWFLNNDSVVARDALTALLRRAGTHPGPGITGSTIRFYGASNVIQAMGGARMDVKMGTSRHIGAGSTVDDIPADIGSVEKQMDYVMGASMLVSRKFIGEIGLMQEDYFLYFEEIDWAIRARGKFTLAYAPRSHVFHKVQTSSNKAVGFSTRFYYRNRIRFTGRFYPQHLGRTKRGLLVEMLRHAAKGRWTHVRPIAATLRDAGRLATEARGSAIQVPEPCAASIPVIEQSPEDLQPR